MRSKQHRQLLNSEKAILEIERLSGILFRQCNNISEDSYHAFQWEIPCKNIASVETNPRYLAWPWGSTKLI